MNTIKKLENNLEDLEQMKLSYTFAENVKRVRLLSKTVVSFLKKLNIYLTYDPFLSFHQRDMDILVHTKICTQMFITASFINSPN